MSSPWSELVQSVSLAWQSLCESMCNELGKRRDAEERRVSINDAFPPEVLTHILSFCHPVHDLQRICLVCKK